MYVFVCAFRYTNIMYVHVKNYYRTDGKYPDPTKNQITRSKLFALYFLSPELVIPKNVRVK